MAEKEWSDLPSDLLRQVADCLALFELLSFRGVCKGWKAASTSASAQIESLSNPNPWFILYGQEETGGCNLITESRQKYITIPESHGATCMSSYIGWLLLLMEESSSLFLLCPFSRARIDLPSFPQDELSVSDHVVAAFSSPPSSQDCVICVANQRKDMSVDLYTLQRGDKEWSKHQTRSSWAKIVLAAYAEEVFYFVDNADGLVKFSVNSKTITHGSVTFVSAGYSGKRLPFCGTKEYFVRKRMKERLGLGDGVSVSTCGMVMPGHAEDELVPYESISGANDESGSQQIKGVWIQPRFHQIDSNQSW